MDKGEPITPVPVDHLPCGCIATTADRRIVFANAYFCDTFGWNHTELVNQNIGTIFHRASQIFCDSYVFPTTLQQGRCTETLLYLLNGGGERIPVVANVGRRADGTMVWVFMEAMNRNKLFHQLETARQALAEQSEQLERIARTDALTGVGNRRELEFALEHAFKDADRSGHPIAVLMVDIDKFKAINDTHGHDMGDRVLCHLAEVLRSACRAGDTVARLGGDEFVCLLPDTAIDEAEALAKRIRTLVARSPIGPCRYSVSIGVSGGAAASGGLHAEFLKFADVAMYKAKAVSIGTRADRTRKSS
jgi:diguanylate cyclase (GGDEF)-like protein